MIDPLKGVRAVGATALPMRPLVVELVGPAAAGKTSLLLSLARDDTTLRAGLRPPRQRHLANAIALTPTFLGLHRPYCGLLWKEMKRITYLTTLQRLVETNISAGERAVVLDEGPVYMLARLLVFGEDRIRSVAFERWWRHAVEQWARLLDVIVWLDAPDPILMHRLRVRLQPHPIKELSDDAMIKFLGTYRAAYDRVVGALATGRGPTVLKLRSDQESLSHLAQRVTAEMRKKEAHRS
jgi:hypothetical protein